MKMNNNNNAPSSCRLCGAKISNPEICGNFVYGGGPGQHFYRCSICDVAFLYPAMDEKQEKNFYNKEFEKFMEKRAGSDNDWSGPEAHIVANGKQYERRLRFLKDLLEPGKNVLEIGCSSGFMLLPLQKKGLSVFGIEPSGGFTSFLSKQGILVFDSFESLKSDCKVKKFDLILHFFVLEHIRDPISFLKNACGLLSRGASMVFEVPSRSDPLITIYDIPAFQKFYWSIAHNFYFNKPSLEFILRRVGLPFEIFPEQRYDLSNHMYWAIEGKPGGQGKFSRFFSKELESAYSENMKETGNCDTYLVRITKKE